MTVVVEEGETKCTTEAGCQTETGVMRVASKASQMNFTTAEDETHAFDYQDKKSNTLSSSDVKVGVVSKFLTSYFRSCDGLKNKLDKEV
jgi:hypothetical protein